MSRSAPILLICLAVVVACQPPAPEPALAPDPDPHAAREALEAASKAFHDGLRANDLEAILAEVADDAVVMPPGEPPVRGKAALRTWFEGFLSQYRTQAMTFSDREVMVGDRWAVELGSYEWAIAPAAGGDAAVDRGNYMQVWTATPEGRWRFAREIWNSTAAPPAPAP